MQSDGTRQLPGPSAPRRRRRGRPGRRARPRRVRRRRAPSARLRDLGARGRARGDRRRGRSRILLGSAVTVLSTDDPVRVFQRFSTLDALSNGRAEVILGRGSFTESYPLFGYDLSRYEELFEDKLSLFAALLKGGPVTWSGSTRTALSGVDDLSADRERNAQDLDRRRRQPGIGRARGALRPAADARDHRRQPGALPAVRRSLPPGAREARPARCCRSPCTRPGTSRRPTSRRGTSSGRTTRR